MIWPSVLCVYILVGGIGCLGLVRGSATAANPHPFDPAAAFALICGTIALWPVLLALAIDRGAAR